MVKTTDLEDINADAKDGINASVSSCMISSGITQIPMSELKDKQIVGDTRVLLIYPN